MLTTLATIIAALVTAHGVHGSFVIDSLFSIYPAALDSLVPLLGVENSEAYLDFKQLAAKYGHPAEEYVVYTEDGYRLEVFRLPGERRIPILLFHGICDSSDTWIVRGDESPAVTLANAGYDVWLGNVRGNKHSVGYTSPELNVNS